MKQVYYPESLISVVVNGVTYRKWQKMGVYKNFSAAYSYILAARSLGYDSRLTSKWVPNGTQVEYTNTEG